MQVLTFCVGFAVVVILAFIPILTRNHLAWFLAWFGGAVGAILCTVLLQDGSLLETNAAVVIDASNQYWNIFVLGPIGMTLLALLTPLMKMVGLIH